MKLFNSIPVNTNPPCEKGVYVSPWKIKDSFLVTGDVDSTLANMLMTLSWKDINSSCDTS